MREMKDSEILGVGKVPISWEQTRLGYECYIRARLGWRGLKADEYVDEGYAFISAFNIQDGKLVWEPLNYITQERYDESPEIKLNIGDVLLVKDGAGVGKSARVDSLPCGGTAPNSSIGVITPYNSMSYRYVCYYIQSPVFSNFVGLLYNGMGVPHLTQEILKTIRILMPPLDEQQSICDYLDEKCAEFDTIKSDIQSQIKVLEEYKCSVITEAVTKGLDPDVEMKDSGVKWIGGIPAHWITHPLYFYFGERKNKNALGLETNLLSLSYGKIIRKDINSNGGLLPESFNTYNIIEKDDIIIRPTDLQNDKRSLRTGIAREHGIITSAYIAMKAIKSVNPEYFHYLLHAYDVMKVFYNMGNGVRQGLNFSEFSRLMVFEPTIEEQNAIVAYLKEKCDEIDSIIAEMKQQIETIEEYKKSLIFEYVTGKKEVATSENVTIISPEVLLSMALIELGDALKGKIHAQKAIYMCEMILKTRPNAQYYKYEHGPYDKNLDKYISKINQKQWFVIHDGSPMTCKKGKNFKKFCEKYKDIISNYKSEVKKIVDFIKPMKTSQAERVATLFAVWNDLIIDGIKTPTDTQIINEVINNWTPNKKNSDISTWENTLKKMKTAGIIPIGFGLHTKPKEC